MAESVDALVSNTSGATRAGSTPALGTKCTTMRWSQRKARCCKTITYSTFLYSRLAVLCWLLFVIVMPLDLYDKHGDDFIIDVIDDTIMG